MRTSLVVLCAALASCGAPPVASERGAAAPPIEWEQWSPETFARAREQGRMVLVDVGIEGCTACRWMYEDTYQHPAVRARVAEHFVAVQVDYNVNPDIGTRYERWGWPATIVLSPEGEQVLALRGNKRPRTFVPILDELIERQAAGRLEADEPFEELEPLADTELSRACMVSVGHLDRFRDADFGGWGRGPVHQVRGGPIEHAFLRGRARGERERVEHALRTARGYAQVLDPVWGGVFVAARGDAWDAGFIAEKRTRHNAAALTAQAHRLALGDEREDVMRVAAEIHRYMEAFLMAPDGTFYATQEDDAPSLPEGTSAADYFALEDAERRRYGVPPVDHGVYTDLNGLMIEAYVSFFEASGEARYLEVARRAADVLLAERRHPDGWIRQSASVDALAEDERMREHLTPERPYLITQARFGLALLALHRATGERSWLEAAEGVARAGVAALEDRERGGFFMSDARDGVVSPLRPARANAVFARFLLQAGAYLHDDALSQSAARALRTVLSAANRRRSPYVHGELALALEHLTLGPVWMVVAGDRDDAAARALFDAARSIYEPRKVLHFDDLERYPRDGGAALFVCTEQACSSPIRDSATLEAHVARYQAAPASAECAGSAVDDAAGD